MSPFRAERDMRFDYYFSDDILHALAGMDKTDLDLTHLAEDEQRASCTDRGLRWRSENSRPCSAFPTAPTLSRKNPPEEPGSRRLTRFRKAH